jgi:DNA topoisomerase IB
MKCGKRKKQKLFSLVSTNDLTKYLKNKNKNLSIKVFRTYKGSDIFKSELARNTRRNAETSIKIKVFKAALEKAGDYLNHQSIDTTLKHYVDPRIIVEW